MRKKNRINWNSIIRDDNENQFGNSFENIQQITKKTNFFSSKNWIIFKEIVDAVIWRVE